MNLYNLAPGKGVIIGDSVAIAEPFYSRVEVTRDGKVNITRYIKFLFSFRPVPDFQSISFDLVRVDSPLILVINGKKASQDFQAGIELATYAKAI